VRKGYTFEGWTSSIGDFKAGDTFIMPDASVVLTAVWEVEVKAPATPEAADGRTIDDGGIPLFGKAGYNWALLNLILAILGVLVAIFAIVRSRRKDQEEDEYGNKEEEGRKARRRWVIISIVAAVLGVILFILTEDMRLPMAIIDRWTIFNAVLFIVSAIGMARASKKQDEEEAQPAQ
jgi:uncharacterized repeat protein (TIGR02543 family)